MLLFCCAMKLAPSKEWARVAVKVVCKSGERQQTNVYLLHVLSLEEIFSREEVLFAKAVDTTQANETRTRHAHANRRNIYTRTI